MTRRVALIAGAEKYEDKNIRSLTCVDNDCTKLDGFFRYAARFDDVRLLRGDSNREIHEAARNMVETLSAGDLFLFYFSGHGVEKDNRHLLLCRHAQIQSLEFFQEVVPVDLLKRLTERDGVDRIFIIDACRSDLLQTKNVKETGLRGERALRDLVNREASIGKQGSLGILCSCSEGQQAVEIPKIGQGLFTAALLRTLESALESGLPLTLSDALKLDLESQMERLSSEHGLPQEQSLWIQRSGRTIPTILPARIPTMQPPAATIAKIIRQEPAEAVPRIKPPQAVETDSLHIISIPSYARLEINGERKGRTPKKINLDKGRHQITASLTGYVSAEQIVWVESGEKQILLRLAVPWIHVPAGTYTAGSRAEDMRKILQKTAIKDIEGSLPTLVDPVRLVHVPEFWITKHPITRLMFLELANSSSISEKKRKFLANPKRFGKPLVNISWQDALAFAKSMGCDLPTAQQWEKAARGPGELRYYPWGNAFNPSFCACDVNSDGKISSVGRHPEGDSLYGVSDMVGNVCDWIHGPREDGSAPCKGGDYHQWCEFYGLSHKVEWVSGGVANELVGLRLVRTSDPRKIEKGLHVVVGAH